MKERFRERLQELRDLITRLSYLFYIIFIFGPAKEEPNEEKEIEYYFRWPTEKITLSNKSRYISVSKIMQGFKDNGKEAYSPDQLEELFFKLLHCCSSFSDLPLYDVEVTVEGPDCPPNFPKICLERERSAECIRVKQEIDGQEYSLMIRQVENDNSREYYPFFNLTARPSK